MAPWEIFASLAWVLSQSNRELSVELVGYAGDVITMQMGAQVQSQVPFDKDKRYDLLYIPGGMGSGVASKDEVLKKYITDHKEDGKIVATNCSGISILWRAGILGNHPITSPATVSARLKEEGANLQEPRPMWLGLLDEKLWTVIGGSGVHPSTVAMIAQYWGEDMGRIIGMMWDTFPAMGEKLFDLYGPECYQYPPYERELQEQMEDILLPKNE